MARKKGKLHRMASSSHLQGNQKHKPADEQQRQSCICMFAYIYEEEEKTQEEETYPEAEIYKGKEEKKFRRRDFDKCTTFTHSDS